MTASLPGRLIACGYAWLFLLIGDVHAGGGPTDYLVVYDPSDANSIAIAQYYQHLREVPEANMVPYVFQRTSTNATSTIFRLTSQETLDLIDALKTAMTNRNLETQIDGIILAGLTPYFVDIRSSFAALNGVLYRGPDIHSTTDVNQAVSGYNNLAYRGATTNLPTTELRGDIAWVSGNTTNRYWITTSLGYPGRRGNNAEEIFSMLQRSKDVDGTKPDGTLYWPTNSDIRSIIRASQIGPVTNEFASLGVDSSIFPGTYPVNKTGPPGSVPVDQRSPIGVLAGFATGVPSTSGSTLLPGSLAEHLTSYAGAFEHGSQCKLSEWVRAGAAGTAGTVTEPFATPVKFPHARMHAHYAAGASLGEAFYESLVSPYQLFIVGDPLTQPFADIPEVAITNLLDGAILSGTTQILVQASSPIGLEPDLDLAVDGRVVRIGDGTEPVDASRIAGGFSLDTTTLTDGHHEIRVIAYNDNSVRTQGYALRNVMVNNEAMSITLNGPSTLDRRSSALFSVTAQGLVGVKNLQLHSGGRTLANVPVQGGSAMIAGTSLGYHGMNTLHATAELDDGWTLSSAPLLVNVTWSALPASSTVNLNTSSVALVRFFANARAPGFSWGQTPSATTFFTNNAALLLNSVTEFPFVAGANATNGHEFITWFNAPTSGVYDFLLTSATEMSLLIDGHLLFAGASSGMFDNAREVGDSTIVFNPIIATEKLAAGFHEIRLRIIQTQPPFAISPALAFFVRGGGLLMNQPSTADVLLSSVPAGPVPAISFAPNLLSTPTVTIVATDPVAAETGANRGRFTVAREGPTNVALAVQYTLGGTATPGADYSNLVGTVTIPQGKLSAVIPVKPIADAVIECTENVLVSLSPSPNYLVGVPGDAMVTINDVPTVNVVATDASASEPGSNRGKFSVNRVGCTNASLKVFYILGGTASYGNDYTNRPPLGASVSIPAGKTSVMITVFPKDDAVAEGAETVALTVLSRPTYTIGSPASATVTVSDND